MSPKSIQQFFKSASPNLQEGAQDQIESESKSTKHSNPNPIPNQTNFKKTTYKIKKIGVDNLGDAVAHGSAHWGRIGSEHVGRAR